VTDSLLVYVGSRRVGALTRNRNGRVEFAYEAEWQSRRDAFPLSLSMPLAARDHPAKIVEPYLWGLLPDNELILERWARRFQVSAGSAFALLGHVGEDCPGAVRLIRSDRASSVGEGGGVDWLDEHDIAERLRALRGDASAWRSSTDTGQFSLAGAQPKTALFHDGARWGVPYGSIPTTHIVKPGVLELDGSAENEHFCLSVARELEIPVVSSRVLRFEDETAIVIDRYDRVVTAEGVERVHQEDACQALGVHPARKYEKDGGPGVRAIVELLRESSLDASTDIETFIAALVYNWLIAGSDAHAKNYSLLIGAGGGARLAPLYDIASALPYADLQVQKLKLAMRIGGKYRLRDIGRYQWKKLASELSLDGEHVLSIASRLVRAAPRAATEVLERSRTEGLRHSVVTTLHTALIERASASSGLLGR